MAANIIYRLEKGVQLTNEEIDDNFRELVDELALKLDSTEFTAAKIIELLDAATGQTLDADTLDGSAPAEPATADTIAKRDASGNLVANQFSGDLVGNVTGDVTGDVSGLAGGIDGQLPISQGGTGAGTSADARTGLGLSIGSDVQAFNTLLQALAALSSSGLIVRTGAGTATPRTITGGLNISVTNGNGVSGNPVINNTGVRTFNGLTGDINVDTGVSSVNSQTGDVVLNFYTEAEADAKFHPLGKLLGNKDKTGDHTFVVADLAYMVRSTGSSVQTFTIPANTFSTGDVLNILQWGTGQITFVAASGATLNYDNTTFTNKSLGQMTLQTIYFAGPNQPVLGGQLELA